MHDNGSVLAARGLSCVFGHGHNATTAVKGADIQIASNEVVSVVGESGSGKTTLARMLLALQKPTAGTLLCDGRPVRKRREHWRQVQAVFQDPFASFNQFFTVAHQLRSCLRLREEKIERDDISHRIDHALRAVNLEPAEVRDKYPFELSGGQMQRLLLARIVLIRPKVLIADEPTSMIDACSRATILEVLLELRRMLHMSIMFITHDLGLAYHVSDRILVMHEGRIVEQGPPDNVILDPQQDYTKRLLADIPVLGREWLSTTAESA